MLRKINLLLAIIAMLIISNTIISAQEDGGIFDSSILSPRYRFIPCTRGISSSITAGINDNLAPPFEPTFQSPNLALWISNNALNIKHFDDPTLNRYVAHSFSLDDYRPCGARICRAQLLVRVCNNGNDIWTNDFLHVGTTDSSGVFTPFISQMIWSSPIEVNQCKTVIVPISPFTLIGLANLDIAIQDDTIVDYMRLDLNF